MVLRWLARPTFSMANGQPQLYNEFCDGVVLEAGHVLLRRRYLLRSFHKTVFTVDPRTPAFQGRFDNMVDPKTERIRSSYLRLARLHGEAIWKHFKHGEPPAPRDFSKGSCMRMAENLLELEIDSGAKEIMPPYFAFSSPTDGWMDATLCLYEAMDRLTGGKTVYLPLAFDHRLLGRADSVDLLIDTILDSGTRFTAIWPVDLNELRATAPQLVGLSYLVQSLGIDVLLMYGGFISRVLSAAFSVSLAAGPCFFERRGLDVSPPLEFMPKCGYYLPQLKASVDATLVAAFYEVLQSMNLDPDLCRACSRNAGAENLDGLVKMPATDIFEHNLLTKRREIIEMSLGRDPVGDALAMLSWIDENRSSFARIHGLGHVKRWMAALSSIDSNYKRPIPREDMIQEPQKRY